MAHSPQLIRHNLYIKDVHEGVKPYQCSACPAAFSQRSKMILHYESIHEGKKPHKCSQCDKSFAQKNQLNSHVTGVHEGKKPFDCPICGTTFKRKHQVKYWILISNGQKSLKKSYIFCEKRSIKKSKMQNVVT